MSGLYPDVPGARVPYDRDGSLVLGWGADNIQRRPDPAGVKYLNSESQTTAVQYPGGWIAGTTMMMAIVLALPVYLGGLYIWGTAASYVVEVSPDTTNGLDGQWTALPASPATSQVKPDYRLATKRLLTPQFAATAIKGVRCGLGSLYALHLYGPVAATATRDRLAFWHPTADVVVPGPYFDFGDVPRSTSADRQFRVKNLSAALRADAVSMSVEVPSDSEPSILTQYVIGDPLGSFGSSQMLGSLAPGEVSGVFTLRHIVGLSAPVSLWTARLNAVVGAWV